MPVYVITGANRGLGLEFVRQLVAKPNNTVVAAVRTLSNDLSDLKALLPATGSADSQQQVTVHILECDTGSAASMADFSAQLKTVLGARPVDYLINNSGINSTPQETSLTMTRESLHEHMDINVLGAQKVTQLLHEQQLLSASASVIVNMSSGIGSVGKTMTMEPRWCTTYSVSKAALNMLTAHQAWDLRDSIRAAIMMDPGWVKTRMGGAGAILEPNVSISGMLSVIHAVQTTDSGKFYCYDGSVLPY